MLFKVNARQCNVQDRRGYYIVNGVASHITTAYGFFTIMIVC